MLYTWWMGWKRMLYIWCIEWKRMLDTWWMEWTDCFTHDEWSETECFTHDELGERECFTYDALSETECLTHDEWSEKNALQMMNGVKQNFYTWEIEWIRMLNARWMEWTGMLYTWVTIEELSETEYFTPELPRINGVKRNAIHMILEWNTLHYLWWMEWNWMLYTW